MFKVSSFSHPASMAIPKDVSEFPDAQDCAIFAEHMRQCGNYVVVEQDGDFLYELDGRG